MNVTETSGSSAVTKSPVKSLGIFRSAGQLVKGAAEKAVGWTKDSFMPIVPRVPLEDINPQTVAWVIDRTGICNTARESLGVGSKYDNGFDVVTILQSSGHIASNGEDDYMKASPREYAACRVALQVLVNAGVVEMRHWPEANANKETTDYQVIDPERLKELANQGAVILKK